MGERVWIEDEGDVVLDERSFVAAGGQGRVWARGARAYKLPNDPAQAVTPAQFTELARVVDPRWIAPQRPILAPDRRRRIGHTMRWVADAVPWAQLAVPAVRARHGIDRPRQLALIDALAGILAQAHRADIAIGDLHGYNVLVVPPQAEIHLVDLDGAHTPSHPLTARAATIADPRSTANPREADWFAFAVLCCELMLGIHPFRGRHPTLATVAERIVARASVFNPAVRLPPCCDRPSSLPPALREWLAAVLERDVREPPPSAHADGAMMAKRVGCQLDPGWQEVLRLDEPIVGWARAGAHVAVIGACSFTTTTGARGTVPPATLGVLILGDEPVAICRGDACLVAVELTTGTPWRMDVCAHDIVVHAGRILGRSGDRLVEIGLRRIGDRPVASVRPLARVSALATRIWPGCAIWESLGTIHIVLAPGRGRSLHGMLPRTHGRVLAASACANACAVDIVDNGEIERVLVHVDTAGRADWVQRERAGGPGVVWARVPDAGGLPIPWALDPGSARAAGPCPMRLPHHEFAAVRGLTALVDDARGDLAIADNALVRWSGTRPALGQLEWAIGSPTIEAPMNAREGSQRGVGEANARCGASRPPASMRPTVERERQRAAASHGGSDLARRYELIGRLAVGGMAELFLARPRDPAHTGHVVVVKRILPQLAEDPEFVRMFRDEANLAATLHHPNIVAVYDVGLQGDEPFFTMEYVHGESLRTIVRNAQSRNEPIPLQHILTIAVGITAALHHAHEHLDSQGRPLMIVHRDVSPTNVLVGYDGVVKIVDFGIAKAAAATHVTQAGMLKGKASYMSPEQCRAEVVDRRSDIFSIGILLYELTTLQRLFRGDNELAILHQILTGSMTPPSQVVPGYPRDLEQILIRTLSTAPVGRQASAAELQQQLEAFAARHGFVINNAALAGYLRERFGARPYPWTAEPVKRAEEGSSRTPAAPPVVGARAAGASPPAAAKPVARPSPHVRAPTPGVLARRATAASAPRNLPPPAPPPPRPPARPLVQPPSPPPELPDELTIPRDVQPAAGPSTQGTSGPSEPAMQARSTPGIAASVAPRDALQRAGDPPATANAQTGAAPSARPGVAAPQPDATTPSARPGVAPPPGATLIPTRPNLPGPGPQRSGPTAAGPPALRVPPPRPPNVASTATEAPARSGSTAMGAPAPARSGATFTPPGPPHSAPTLRPVPSSVATSDPVGETNEAAGVDAPQVAPGVTLVMSAEQAAFLRGERPDGAVFSAGAPEATQIAVRTEVSAPAPPSPGVVPTSAPAAGDAAGGTVIAPPPTMTTAKPDASPDRTVLTPANASPDRTVLAPANASPDRTVLAPANASPDRTVLAPPGIASPDRTVLTPPGIASPDPSVHAPANASPDRTAVTPAIESPDRTVGAPAHPSPEPAALAPVTASPDRAALASADRTVLAPPNAAPDPTVLPPASHDPTLIAPAALDRTVLTPAHASPAGAAGGEPSPPRTVLDRTVMLPPLGAASSEARHSDDEPTLVTPPRASTGATAAPADPPASAGQLGPARSGATQPLPVTPAVVAETRPPRSRLLPISLALGVVALLAGSVVLVWSAMSAGTSKTTDANDGSAAPGVAPDAAPPDDTATPGPQAASADEGTPADDDPTAAAADGSTPTEPAAKEANDTPGLGAPIAPDDGGDTSTPAVQDNLDAKKPDDILDAKKADDVLDTKKPDGIPDSKKPDDVLDTKKPDDVPDTKKSDDVPDAKKPDDDGQKSDDGRGNAPASNPKKKKKKPKKPTSERRNPGPVPRFPTGPYVPP